MCREEAGELPRKNQAELSSTHLEPGIDVYLLLVLGEMPPGEAFTLAVCCVKPCGTEANPESSFFSFASLSTGKPWMAFGTVSLFRSLSNSGHIEAL